MVVGSYTIAWRNGIDRRVSSILNGVVHRGGRLVDRIPANANMGRRDRCVSPQSNQEGISGGFRAALVRLWAERISACESPSG